MDTYRNMREFDLADAKAGKKLCTRDGCPARIICWDYRDSPDAALILALITTGSGREIVFKYQMDGRVDMAVRDDEEHNDLMMAIEPARGWVNIYRNDTTWEKETGGVLYDSRQEAEAHAACARLRYLGAFPVEYND